MDKRELANRIGSQIDELQVKYNRLARDFKNGVANKAWQEELLAIYSERMQSLRQQYETLTATK